MTTLQGYIRDTFGQPLTRIPVQAFFHRQLIGDHKVTELPLVTDNTGYFETNLRELNATPSNFYLIVIDVDKKFVSVRDWASRYKKQKQEITYNGRKAIKWKSAIIENLDTIIDIIVNLESKVIQSSYDSVVIGSGFGGTIVSLSIARKYFEKNIQDSDKRRVCILERGQWWLSHEVLQSFNKDSIDSSSLRTFLVKNDFPFRTWAYPNDTKGMFLAIRNSMAANKVEGLYDFRRLKNVNVISGSGVGGGSLVYFNLTVKPDYDVYKNWPTERDGGASLEEYYPIAEEFIGVNPITSVSAFSDPPIKIPKSKVFQDATKRISDLTGDIMNLKRGEDGKPITDSNGKAILDADANLSITDLSKGVFNPDTGRPNQDDIKKYSEFIEKNICQRQGRCGLGCIAEARHTLSKHLFNAMVDECLPVDIQPLCEVLEVRELNGQDYKYSVKFLDYRDIIDFDDFSPTRELTEEERNGITKIIKTNHVILAAGTLGSTEILLKSKSLDLSDMLGKKFSTNGDFFGIVNPTKYKVDSSRGPMLTSIALFKDKNGIFAYAIEDLGIPRMFADVFATIFNIMKEHRGSSLLEPFRSDKSFAKLFTQIVLNKIDFEQDTRNVLSKIVNGLNVSFLATIGDILSNIVNIFSRKPHQSPEERVANILVLFGMGRDVSSKSNLIFDNNKNKIDLDANYDLNQPIYKSMLDAMKLFAKEIGKEGENSLLVPFWDTQSKTQITAHPIGGCPMADNASKGVVDSFGRIFRGKAGNSVYPGLYVADGSIIPTSLGVNPSLTISALAFRIASHIVQDLS
jgi:cholesterol oxidase